MNQALKTLYRRVMLMLGRAIVKAVNDANGTQRLQLALGAGELSDAVRHLQSYGLTAVPLPGAEGVVLALKGNRDHPVAIAVDDPRHRPRALAAGEVCLYAAAGQRLHLQANGDVTITAPGKIVLSADGETKPVARIGDKVQVSGGSSAGLWPIVEGSDKVEAG